VSYNKNLTAEIQEMVEILELLGIEMNVSGCGCCGSPSVFFKYKNKIIINSDNVNFSTKEI
jgi:Fe-S oxidoreductase